MHSRNISEGSRAVDNESSMRVSVIIPTKNRASELRIVTSNLLEQTLLPNEIVIIDQSADQRSRRAVEQAFGAASDAIRNSVRLQYVLDRSINGGSAARNRGMELATGEVCLFLDDDVELEKNFVEEIVRALRARPDATAICGMITNYLPPSWGFRLWNSIFALGPFFDERQPLYWKADRLRGSEPLRVHKLNGGAMAFRAEAIRNLRFDEQLVGVSLAEDVDFAARIEPGIIVMAPAARLIHKRSPHGRASDHWLRAQVQASYYLYSRNWRHGISNRLRFMWLNVGYGLAAVLSCVKNRSSESFAAIRQAVNEARHALSGVAVRPDSHV